MASIIDIYTKSIPKTGVANIKGGDKTPISADGGVNLTTDESKLSKARKGAVNTTKKYSELFKK
jgi:hypothetical protein